MIQHFKTPLIAFLIFNFLIALPLYFLWDVKAGTLLFTLSTLQTFVWFVLIQVITVGFKLKTNNASLALAVISVKFFLSIAIFILLYLLGFLDDNFYILIFLGTYVFYAIAMAWHSNSMLEENNDG